MKIEEFFNKTDEEIISFDFTDEVLRNIQVKGKYINLKKKYLNKDINILEKYILYKTEFKIDPDAKKGLLKEIYSKLWDKEILDCCKSNSRVYFSDTMTSVQGLLNGYYVISCPTEWKNYSKNKEVQYYGIKVFKDMFNNKDKYLKYNKKVFHNQEVINFIKYYHTLGNYIPVPKGFNEYRAGFYASHDMWDITLEKIKEYYDEKLKISKSLEPILELLHISNNTINNTIIWLDSFGSWENFVDCNYLKEENNHKNYVNKNYKINKLAEHNFLNPNLKSEEEYLNYFKKITEIIRGRTLIMKESYIKKGEKDNGR